MKKSYFIIVLLCIFSLIGKAQLSATISGTKIVCLNDTSPLITFSVAGSTSGDAPFIYTYTINGATIQDTSSNTNDVVTLVLPNSTVGTFAYVLTNVTDNLNNPITITSSTATITVLDLNLTTAGTDTLVCKGNSINLTSTVTGNESNTVNYAWTGPDGYTSSLSSPTIVNSTIVMAGDYTVTATVGACQTQDIVNVVVQEPKIESLGGSAIVVLVKCFEPSWTFTFNLSTQSYQDSIVDYVIDWGDGSPSGTFTTASGPISHLYLIGSYNLSIQMNLTNGCSTTKVYSVFIGSSPAPATMQLYAGEAQGCVPHSTHYDFIIPPANPDGTTYVVSWGDGTPDETYVHPVSISTLVHIYDSTSCGHDIVVSGVTYYDVFQPTVVTQNPCAAPQPSGSAAISVGEGPDAIFTPNNNNISPINHCVGDPLQLTNTSDLGFIIATANTPNRCSADSTFYWTISPYSPGLWNATGLGSNNGFLHNEANWTVGSMTPTVTFNTPGAYTITIRHKSPCGESSFSQEFCVEPKVTPLFTLSNPLIGCAPLVVSANSSATDTSESCSPVTYLWNINYTNYYCGTSDSVTYLSATSDTSSNPIFQFNNAGKYTISLTTTNDCGSLTSASQTVSIKQPPEESIAALDSTCGPVVYTPNATLVNCGTDPLTYLWTFGGGTPASSVSLIPPPVSFNSVGSHLISLAVTNECGVTNTSQSFLISAPPVATAAIDTQMCIGEFYNLSGSVSGGTPGYNYTWTSVPIGFNSSNPNPADSPISTTTYTLSVSDLFGCKDSLDVIITIDTLPIVSVNSGVICFGDSITLTASNADTYQWNQGSITDSLTVSPAGTTSYVVTGTNATTGCSDSFASIVTVSSLPIVQAGSNITLCNLPISDTLIGYSPAGGVWSGAGVTTNGVFTPSGIGTFTLTYTYIDPITTCINMDSILVTVVVPGLANAGVDFSICLNDAPVALNGFSPSGGLWSGAGVSGNNFSPLGAGSGAHILTYSYGTGTCFNQDTIRVIVNSFPIVSVNSDVICFGESIILTAAGADAYQWNQGPITDTLTVSPAGTTSYAVTGTNTTTGCRDSVASIVTVNSLPIVQAGADTTLCNLPIPHTLTGYSPLGGVWSGAGVTTNGVFTASGIGTFTLTYTYTNSGTGCINMDSILVIVVAPVLANAGAGFSLCLNDVPVALTGFSPPGGLWSGAGISGNNFSHLGSGPGSHILTYSYGTGTCFNQDTIRVIVDTLPIVSVNSGVICFSDSITLTAIGADTYQWNHGPITNPLTVSPADTTSYVVTGTSIAGCSDSVASIVMVKSLPIIQAGSDITLCNVPIPDTLIGYSPLGGVWSGAGVTTNGVFMPSGIGIFTLTYTYTDLVTTCVNMDSILVTVIAGGLPILAVSLPPIACVNTSINFVNTTSNALSYVWNFGNTLLSTNPNPTHTYNTLGFFTVQLTATSSQGCIDSLSQSIEIIDPPVANFSMNIDSGCAPLQVIFTNNSLGNYTTYLWDYGNGNTSNLQMPVNQVYQQGLNDTNYIISLDITNQCGFDNYTDSILVRPLPVVSFVTSLLTGCSPLPINVNNLSSGATTYIWDYGDGSPISNNFSPSTHTYTAFGSATTYDLKLIGINSCGNDTLIIPIFVKPDTVQAFFPLVPNGCAPYSVSLNNLSTGGTFILWNFGDGNVSSLPNPTHVYQTAGTYTIAQFVNNGCSFDTMTATIQVYPEPVVGFNMSSNNVCLNEMVSFINASVNSVNYSWDFGDGNSSTLTNPTHTYITPGSYTVTLYGYSALNGCVDTVDNIIVVGTSPVAMIAPSVLFGCQPLTVNYQNISTNALFYQWDFGDNNTSSVVSPSHIFDSVGVYTVQLMAGDLQGCKDSTVVVITVFSKPDADFSLSSTYFCSYPEMLNLTNNSVGANSYLWDFDNGSVSTQVNTNVVYNQAGVFDIQLIASNSYNCTDTIIKSFEVYDTPQVAFSPSINKGCQPLTVTFTNSSLNGVTFIWDFGDGTESFDYIPVHTYTESGSFTVKLIIYNGSCSDTLIYTDIIVVYPKPIADFSYQDFYVNGVPDGSVGFLNASKNANSYQWNFGDNETSNEIDPTHRYQKQGAYTVELIAISEFGCKDTVIIIIENADFHGLYVPNALKPDFENSDARLFLPKGQYIREYHLQIFDTWGTLIFESKKLDVDGRPVEGWDGTFQGEKLPQDVYVWKISAVFTDGTLWLGKKYQNGKFKRTGTVTLVK